MLSIRELLLALGVTSAEKWSLEVAVGISGDGQVIVGNGRNPNRQKEAWVAVIPMKD